MNVFTLLRREKKEPRKTRRDKREETRDGWPRSLWRDTNRRFFFQSPAVDLDADVLIVGAGFSGLWTAAHLKMSDPGLNIVVIDAHQPGFGALTESEAKTIQQNGFASTGFASEYRQPGIEAQVKLFDQHHIANGERGEHWRAAR